MGAAYHRHNHRLGNPRTLPLTCFLKGTPPGYFTEKQTQLFQVPDNRKLTSSNLAATQFYHQQQTKCHMTARVGALGSRKDPRDLVIPFC